MRSPRPYADPYLAGVILGLVLLASFVFAGRGVGASGAFVWGAEKAVTPFLAVPGSSSEFLGESERAPNDPTAARGAPKDRGTEERAPWIVFEVAGIAVGGFLSALLAGRVRASIERGPRISPKARLACAFGGGALMGVGAVLARGCTSGLALTGGALLSVGSWLFVGAAFGAAYLVAPLLRRAWR